MIVDFLYGAHCNNCNIRRKKQRERRNPDNMYLSFIQTSCGHNLRLKCFQKWIGQGKDTSVKCRRQWGVHWPHIAGITEQAIYGAQPMVLSGGYEDDEDHGEWFLYRVGEEIQVATSDQ